MAVILTGTEYIDLDAHGAALDIRQRPLSFYAELDFTATEIMLPFSHGRANNGDQEWALFVNIGGAGAAAGRWENSGLTTFQAEDTGSYNDDAVHRVLVTVRTSANRLDLYIDGAQVATNEGLGATTATADLNNLTRIGMNPDGNNFFFVGQISNCALWDVEISDADAQDLTAGTTTPGDLLTGIVEWWPLDFDARGEVNGLDGTPVGSPSFTESPPSQDGSASGSYGYTGTAAGHATVLGSASGSYAYTGTAQGQATVLGSASGSYAYVGTADGEAETLGSASGSYGYSGTASGQATVVGSVSGAYGYEGIAIGTGEATGVEPVILPPFREPAPAAFREPKIPAFREPPP